MPDTENEIEELREEIRRLREQPNGRGEGRGPDAAPPQAAEAPSAPASKEEKRPLGRRFAGWIRTHPVALIVGLVLLVAVVIGGWLLWQYFQTYESTDDAFIDGHINSITPRIAGTIVRINVVENQTVKKGDLLIELDPSDFQVALERAQANFQQARASTQAQQTGIPITSTSTQTTIETARSEVLNTQAGLAAAEREREAESARLVQAEANNAKAQADLARYRTLVAKDEVSREEFDQRVAAAAAAAAAVDAGRAAVAGAAKTIEQRSAELDEARLRQKQAVRNAPEQVTAQRAGVDVQRAAANASRAAVNEAELNLQYTKIYAPVNGVAGRRGAELGQRVQPGQQLLSLVQLDDIWVTANFKENQLRAMHPNQRATIHVDAYDRDYEGYVESMPAASSASFSVLPPENASGNYVKVVQRLPVRLRFKPGQDPHQQLRPGLSVVPKVWLK